MYNMDKPAIKKFAVWARKKLIADTKYRAGLVGVTETTVAEPLPQSNESVQFFDVGLPQPYRIESDAVTQRQRFVAELNKETAKQGSYTAAYQTVVDKVAYTWFNRLIAVRYMEVNDLLPSRTRVLSSADGRAEPQIVTSPFDAVLDYTPAEQQQIVTLKNDNKLDEAFRLLFLKQCAALGDCLPRLFEQVDDYMPLLLALSFTDKDGVVCHLVNDIPESDWQDAVQIVGWLYQYYNTEPKEQVFANLKKNIKISAENIPAATQLFTPDWIVRYMVENSLGRLWSEGHPDFDKSEWKYYLDEAPQEPQVAQQLAELRKGYAALTPEDIKCIDPCMGSGHILAYLFDVLMQIYRSAGYTDRDAAASIVEHNLYGLDIDDRAAQMAYFVVMMKGCHYDSRFLRRHLNPHVYAIQESGELTTDALGRLGKQESTARALLDGFKNAKEYGSILQPKVTLAELDALQEQLREVDGASDMGSLTDQLVAGQIVNVLYPLIEQARMLVQKYDVVVTNPPYAGAKGLNTKLTEYIQANFQEEKGDLFAAFIARIENYLKLDGFAGMITPTAWLYNPTYNLMRKKQLNFMEITNLVELGSDAFEVGFGTVMFTFSRKVNVRDYIGTYLDIKSEVSLDKEIEKLTIESSYAVKMRYFNDYEGYKFSYKLTEPYRLILQTSQPLCYYGKARAGLQTDDNARFIREWYEVESSKIDFQHKAGSVFDDAKWFPHIKGGTYRKWYGNLSNVVNWQYDGVEIKESAAKKYGSYTKRVQSQEYYFKEGLAWTHTTYSQPFACRYVPCGIISNVEGPEIFDLGIVKYDVLGMLNSKVMDSIFMRMSDSIHYLAGELSKFPVKLANSLEVNEKVQQNIEVSKSDWDSFETSWDFKRHPLV